MCEGPPPSLPGLPGPSGKFSPRGKLASRPPGHVMAPRAATV